MAEPAKAYPSTLGWTDENYSVELEGQQDDYLPSIPLGLVPRDRVVKYPKIFRLCLNRICRGYRIEASNSHIC